ncbi:GNAT family N-acetyltransferase [Massilia jejuensis]|uniref:GNAT family N-acetyltransferase n=1 Tax=Massilia jejuensis TaxID=648894 RepID=A0ABW0PLF2_9BURK
MHIEPETPDQPEVAALLAQLHALLLALYPAARRSPPALAALQQPEVRFLVARDDAGRAAGCVALKRHDGYGEAKCMVVDAAARGQGIGRALLEQLALHALAAGVHELRLTTGARQRDAIALYERFGFTRCAPYGGAVGADEVCMEKRL